MPTRSRSSASWERVLAAMEADAARAAALLVSDDAAAVAGIEYDGQDAAPTLSLSTDEPPSVPATWRLPVSVGAVGAMAGRSGLTGGAAARAVAGYAAAAAAAAPARAPAPVAATPEPAEPFELPDLTELADMPELSPEQRERFEALHARITELQTELAAAMAEAETVLARPIPRRIEVEPRPELVDRRL
ncbi:MAG: hypothetical protein ABI382_06630 [Nakamurella sp.]